MSCASMEDAGLNGEEISHRSYRSLSIWMPRTGGKSINEWGQQSNKTCSPFPCEIIVVNKTAYHRLAISIANFTMTAEILVRSIANFQLNKTPSVIGEVLLVWLAPVNEHDWLIWGKACGSDWSSWWWGGALHDEHNNRWLGDYYPRCNEKVFQRLDQFGWLLPKGSRMCQVKRRYRGKF